MSPRKGCAARWAKGEAMSSVVYFPATVMGGRLHVTGTMEGRLCDSSTFDWWREDELNLASSKGSMATRSASSMRLRPRCSVFEVVQLS